MPKRSKEKVKAGGAKPHSGVLVYGSGYSGLSTALALADKQVKVDLIETPGESLSPGLLSSLLDDSDFLTKLQADAQGNMNISFIASSYLYPLIPDSGGYILKGATDASYGAVVFAPERLEQNCREKGAYNLK